MLCEALCIVGRAGSAYAMPLPRPRRSAEPARSPLSSAFGRGGWRLSSVSVRRSRSSRSGRHDSCSARDLALDGGLLIQAAGAEIILAEQAYVAQGPARSPRAGASCPRPWYSSAVCPTCSALGDLLLAQSSAVPGRERQVATLLASVEARGELAPDTLAQVWAVRALPLLLSHDLPGGTACSWIGSPTRWWITRRPLRCTNSGCGCWSAPFVGEDDAEARSRVAPAAGWSAQGQSRSPAVRRGDCRGSSRPPGSRPKSPSRRVTEHLAPVPYWHRLLRLFACECALEDGWGDPLPQLRVDLVAHERNGDEAQARICRDLLRRAGAPTRRGRGDSSVPPELRGLGVTSREMDVLRLVASGLSNADIAQRLYLSPRTVETHVSSLLARTGCHSRQELRGFLDRLTP